MSKNWCDFCLIYLGKGEFTLVDKEDSKKLKKHRWYYTSHGYAARSIWRNGKSHIQYMHRQIMKINDKSICVDHISMDILDNRKCNLRSCTKGENLCNRKLMKGFTSKYKGVYWSKCAKKWVAQVTLKQKKYYLGLFNNEVDAAIAYDKAAISLHKNYARTNFERGSYE